MQNIGVGHRQNVSVLVLHMDDLRPGGSSSSYKKEFLLLHIIDKAMHSSFVTLITCNSVKNEDWCPLPSIYIFFFTGHVHLKTATWIFVLTYFLTFLYDELITTGTHPSFHVPVDCGVYTFLCLIQKVDGHHPLYIRVYSCIYYLHTRKDVLN